MDEDDIQNVDDVTHANGIIRFSKLQATEPNGISYKTIFPLAFDELIMEYNEPYGRLREGEHFFYEGNELEVIFKLYF